MLGDTAVAVHPDDERYADLVGRRVEVPLTGRDVVVVADAFVDPAFGTGAVKITPAHDPNDFALGRRHGLPELAVIDPDGRMGRGGGRVPGLDRFEARARVADDLRARGAPRASRSRTEHAVGQCQRCATPVEPLVSTQWFVRMAELARPAIEAVETGRTRFVPEAWSKTYFEWMRNIHDWCISRQLWWGHRIPAWYCDGCGTMLVAVDPPRACTACSGTLRQDEDVLDTWFSSALWPFSTMGWPDETQDLARYYPTQLLITGHDIIFFWVARMMMMGLKFRDEVPFRNVYIHGLVRDDQGRKMSKSKGNAIDAARDPGALRHRRGAVHDGDPRRAGQRHPAGRETHGGVPRVREQAVERIAVRPAPHRGRHDTPEPSELSRRALDPVAPGGNDRRRRSGAGRAAASTVPRMLLYHFVWHEFCDWYIELAKPDLAQGAPEARARSARSTLHSVLATVLRLLHPFMPFLTEELWHRLPGERGLLALESWPQTSDVPRDATAEADVTRLQEIVVKIRNLRGECRIEPGQRIRLLLHTEDRQLHGLLEAEAARVGTLVRASEVEIVAALDPSIVAARGVGGGVQIAIPLAGLLDLEAEGKRIRRDLARVTADVAGRARKLADSRFLAGAPPEIVDKERRLHAELLQEQAKIERHLTTLGLSPSDSG